MRLIYLIAFLTIFIGNEAYAKNEVYNRLLERCKQAAIKTEILFNKNEKTVPSEITEALMEWQIQDGMYTEEIRKQPANSLYEGQYVDLNQDGNPEIIVRANHGGGAHCALVWIYKKEGNIYRQLLSFCPGGVGNFYPILLNERTHGYNDICEYQHVSVDEGIVVIYAFNGVYKPIRCEENIRGDGGKFCKEAFLNNFVSPPWTTINQINK